MHIDQPPLPRVALLHTRKPQLLVDLILHAHLLESLREQRALLVALWLVLRAALLLSSTAPSAASAAKRRV